MTLNYTDEHALRNIDKSITSILESFKLVSTEVTQASGRREWNIKFLFSMQTDIQTVLAKHKRETEGMKVREDLILWKNEAGEYELWDTSYDSRLATLTTDEVNAMMEYWNKC